MYQNITKLSFVSHNEYILWIFTALFTWTCFCEDMVISMFVVYISLFQFSQSFGLKFCNDVCLLQDSPFLSSEGLISKKSYPLDRCDNHVALNKSNRWYSFTCSFFFFQQFFFSQQPSLGIILHIFHKLANINACTQTTQSSPQFTFSLTVYVVGGRFEFFMDYMIYCFEVWVNTKHNTVRARWPVDYFLPSFILTFPLNVNVHILILSSPSIFILIKFHVGGTFSDFHLASGWFLPIINLDIRIMGPKCR